MKRKKSFYTFTVLSIIVLVFILAFTVKFNNHNKIDDVEEVVLNNKVTGVILDINDGYVTILDNKNLIYNISLNDDNLKLGDYLVIEYTGVIDSLNKEQLIEIIDYEKQDIETDKYGIPVVWKDDGIFSKYYTMAFYKLKELSLDEKIGQLLLVRYPSSDAVNVVNKYTPGGFVFFAKDFAYKDKNQVLSMINSVQDASKIPLLTAVDEEGGSVVRVSSNSKLADSKFKSPHQLYMSGGFDEIREDTINKSNLLKSLGLNLNLAPVVDVSTNASDYIYNRTLGEDTEKTSIFAKTVIEASKGSSVSYTLKHFPGYGNNDDTHLGTSIDTRSYEDILTNDIPPFQAGINAGAEAVLVSHNVVTSIDDENPASLSPAIHNLLRNKLDFTGVIITDDIAMNALNSIDNIAVKAILAGNDLIITTDYQESFNQIKNALNNNLLDEFIIDQHVFRILAWKYYKNLMLEQKE